MRKSLLFIFMVAVLMWCATAQAQQQLTLTWTDNSTNETSFKVERGTVLAGPFTQIGTTLANVATFIDSGLPDATQFCYRVRAGNAGGDSAFSNVACATTKTTPPAPPTNLVVQ